MNWKLVVLGGRLALGWVGEKLAPAHAHVHDHAAPA